MVRCADFYEKWKKDPNWCEKSPAAVSRINSYLSLIDEICERENLTPELVSINFPERAARAVMSVKDEAVKKVVINDAIDMVRRGVKVTSADVSDWIEIESREINGENRRDALPMGKSDTEINGENRRDEPGKPGSVTSEISVKPEPTPPQGMTIRDVPPPPKPAPFSSSPRVIMPGDNPNIHKFTVELNRTDMAGIRQMIQRRMCEDEEEAVQSCFEEGLNVIMDRIEAMIQMEADEGGEVEA